MNVYKEISEVMRSLLSKGATQREIATVYALHIGTSGFRGSDGLLADMIKTRWSTAGLENVTKLAWKIIDQAQADRRKQRKTA